MTIQIDDRGIRQELPGGQVEQVAWDDLREVVIMATSGGPFVEDVFYVLTGQGGTGCVIPLDAPESDRLVRRLLGLPGFDKQAFGQAMGSTQDVTFVCWRRPAEAVGGP